MSDLVRLTRTLHEAARGWGKVENDWGGEPRLTEIGAAHESSSAVLPNQTTFRIALFNPGLGGEREFTVTISATDRSTR